MKEILGNINATMVIVAIILLIVIIIVISIVKKKKFKIMVNEYLKVAGDVYEGVSEQTLEYQFFKSIKKVKDLKNILIRVCPRKDSFPHLLDGVIFHEAGIFIIKKLTEVDVIKGKLSSREWKFCNQHWGDYNEISFKLFDKTRAYNPVKENIAAGNDLETLLASRGMNIKVYTIVAVENNTQVRVIKRKKGRHFICRFKDIYKIVNKVSLATPENAKIGEFELENTYKMLEKYSRVHPEDIHNFRKKYGIYNKMEWYPSKVPSQFTEQDLLDGMRGM